MSIKRVGSKDGTSLVAYPSHPKKSRDAAGNWTLTYKYWCKASSAESLTPATGSTPPAPESTDHSDLEITGVDIQPLIENPGMVECEFTYSYPSASSDTPLLPDEVRQECDTGVQDANIVQQLVEVAASESDKNEALNDQKKKTYLAPVPIYRRMENISSFTFSEANIVENVGKREAPTGMDTPTAGKWLKTRLSITQEGSRFIQTEEWAYASAAWDGPEYESAV